MEINILKSLNDAQVLTTVARKPVGADIIQSKPAQPVKADIIEDSVSISPAALSRKAADNIDPMAKAAKILSEVETKFPAINSSLMDIKVTLVQLADQNISSDKRTELQNEFNKTVEDIKNFLNQSSDDVRNFLQSADGITIPASDMHSEIKIPGMDIINSLVNTLGTAPGDAQGAIQKLIGPFANALWSFGAASSTTDQGLNRIQTQMDFEKSVLAAVTPPEVKAKETSGKNGLTEAGSDYKSALNVATTVINKIQDVLGQSKAYLSVLTDQNLSDQARTQYQNAYNSTVAQLNDFVKYTDKLDMGLLQNNNSFDLVYNKNGRSLNLQSFDLNSRLLGKLPTGNISPTDAISALQNILPGVTGDLNIISRNFQHAHDIIQKSTGGWAGFFGRRG